MPPKKVTIKQSRITKSKARTRPSLPRAAKSKSRYKTLAVVEDSKDEDVYIQEIQRNEKTTQQKETHSLPAIITLGPLVTNPSPNIPFIAAPNIPRTRSPAATRIILEEENLAARADDVWALYRHHYHSHSHSPCSSPLRHHSSSLFPPRRRSSSSSVERYPGPLLADPRLSPNSNRRILTQKAKFVAMWEADEGARERGVSLEEYTVAKRRPGVVVKLREDDKDVERWRPEKPVFESFISEEDMRVWKERRKSFERAWSEDEVAQGEGVSLFDYTRTLSGVVKAMGKKSDKQMTDKSKDVGIEVQGSIAGAEHETATSHTSSNSEGSLFLGMSPTTLGVNKQIQRDLEKKERNLLLERPEVDIHRDAFGSPSKTPNSLKWVDLKCDKRVSTDVSTHLAAPEQIDRFDVQPRSSWPDSTPDLSDWTSHLFTREELVAMIDLSVNNVYLDCLHCDLIVRHGLPIPLPFALKERCTCTRQELMAKEYRAKGKDIEGQIGRDIVAAGEEDFERAVQEKRAMIGELADRSLEERKTMIDEENDRVDSQVKMNPDASRDGVARGKLRDAVRKSTTTKRGARRVSCPRGP